MPETTAPRLELSQVTLIAISSVNVEATVKALQSSSHHIDFAAVKLVTDKTAVSVPDDITVVSIDPLASARDYSAFVLSRLADLFETSHCLLVQWDGYAIRPVAWRAEFLDCDYIGARWPHFVDEKNVGNGGFSLRSRALAEACRSPEFHPSHPEDLAICRKNREWLESEGLRFAAPELADAFSTERAGSLDHSFGFHGVWHMPRVLGNEAFFDLYQRLDERSSVWHDFALLLRLLSRGKGGLRRAIRLTCDWLVTRVRD